MIRTYYYLNERSSNRHVQRLVEQARTGNVKGVIVGCYMGLPVCTDVHGLYLDDSGEPLDDAPLRISELPVRLVRLERSGEGALPHMDEGTHQFGSVRVHVEKRVVRGELYWNLTIIGKTHREVLGRYHQIFPPREHLDQKVWDSEEVAEEPTI